MSMPQFNQLDFEAAEWVMPDPDDINPDQAEAPEYKESDPAFVEPVKETPRAKRYRLKAKRGLNFLMRATVEHPATVADAAAIVQYGPPLSKAIGNLADNDERVRKAIDFLTEDGIENPWVLTAITVLPLAFQCMRNHEKHLDKEIQLGFRIPRTKRRIQLPFKFRLRFKFIRQTTQPPDFLTEHVFGNTLIQDALAKQDIKIAWPPNYRNNGYRRG